jgi:hypothetical protein
MSNNRRCACFLWSVATILRVLEKFADVDTEELKERESGGIIVFKTNLWMTISTTLFVRLS